MPIVVSPYHLTTREAPALAAFLLADRVVTFLPAPFQTMRPADLADAADALPRYRRFVESWRWTEPLWTCGALASRHDAFDPFHDVRAAHAAVTDQGREPDLLRFMRFGLFEDEREYLDAVAADVLKGGPDPGISIPVTAGLDRFAVRGGMPVARTFSTSLAQRAEDRLGTRLFAFAIPVFTQASGDALASARDLAAEFLGDLRDATSNLCEMTSSGSIEAGASEVSDAARRVTHAAERLAPRLHDVLGDVARRADARDTRCVVSTATVTGVSLPVDAVIRSSAAAARAFAGAGSTSDAASGPSTKSSRDDGGDSFGAGANLPVLADDLHGRRVISLTVKVIGAPTRPRSI